MSEMSDHPFDRYAAFTDLEALKEASNHPLRKCLRVNTLKCSVEEFKKWAQKNKWDMEPVPWCREGFFIDRADHSKPLGKDLLHLLGHFYMQEASSMLPVELLDPRPGETILDMSAAPGSKTTQIAAKMKGSGVLIANDMQEKRLGTLKDAVHRLGVTNTIITKKTGQWFAPHMTERFDRVLCDAPCTAQGTIRKDTSALDYSSEHSVRKCASLQRSLLESAIHCAKVGGRIVYSTCTLTPEENEEVALHVLNKFNAQLKVVELGLNSNSLSCNLSQAISDSKLVQKKLGTSHSFIRIWPQTYNTEGFFCAVFEKIAPTKEPKKMKRVFFQEKPTLRHRMNEKTSYIEKRFLTTFLQEREILFERENQLLLSTQEVADFSLPMENYTLGVSFGKSVKDGRVRLTQDIASLRGHLATQNTKELSDKELTEIIDGKDISCDSSLSGEIILIWKGRGIGLGLAQNGVIKNRIARWLVKQSS
jgi:16S rRNA (cytosine1407-C5)-methyltransferase